jgi:hypothetical protein
MIPPASERAPLACRNNSGAFPHPGKAIASANPMEISQSAKLKGKDTWEREAIVSG